jgi:hypothetical protein
MRGVYDAPYRIAGLNSARTLLLVTAPATAIVEILSTELTDENNATNQQLTMCWQRVTSLGTPTATTITPSKTETGDQAAASTVKANVTASEPTYGAAAQGGAIVNMHGLTSGPSVGGLFYDPIPEKKFTIAPGETWGLRLLNAPSASFDASVNASFREIG